MAPQEWISPHSFAGDPASAAPPPAPGYDLRPLSVGEVLDRVFSLYRSHFWFFAGLSAVSAGINPIIGILRLAYIHFTTANTASASYAAVVGWLTLAQFLLYLLAYSLTMAATTFAVNAFYLRQPTSLTLALTSARGVWLRCLSITSWQGWSAIWACLLIIPIIFIPRIRSAGGPILAVAFILALLAALVYGVIAYLRNSLALPAAIVEDLGVRASMRRSKRLAGGHIGRIFLLLLLIYALWMVAAVIQVPFLFLAARSPDTFKFSLQGITLVINFITTTVVGPIASIGLCLFYFDERVRREGFDIEVLLHNASQPAAPPPAPIDLPASAPEQI